MDYIKMICLIYKTIGTSFSLKHMMLLASVYSDYYDLCGQIKGSARSSNHVMCSRALYGTLARYV